MGDISPSYGASALKSTGPSISMVDNGGMGGMGIGNYKGVMLCNRPFGGSVGMNKSASTSDKPVFNTGVVSDTVGINVPIAAREKQMRRPKKDSVLIKHKKWLADLQKTKDRLEYQYLEEMRTKELAQIKFQEHEKKMREASRTILKNKDESKDSSSTFNFTAEAKDIATAEDKLQSKLTFSEDKNMDDKSQTADEKSVSSNSPGKINKAGAKLSAKPAWALTEKAAESAEEEKLLEEENDLIDFALGLDYDQCIDDIETRTVMEKLRKKIVELEKEVEQEDSREADAEQRAARREMLQLMTKAAANLHSEDFNKNGKKDETYLAAKALLDAEEGEQIQSVHSTQSVSMLLKQAKDKIQVVQEAVKKPVMTEHKILNEPVVVTHEPSEGSRLEGKNFISNLPYMHRNPAI